MPVAPPRDWVEQIRASLPEAPAKVRARLRTEWNVSALEMDAIVNAGALDLVLQTVAAGASPADARKWWLGELSRRAQRHRHRAGRPPDHPGSGRPDRGAGRRGHAQRQAGPRR